MRIPLQVQVYIPVLEPSVRLVQANNVRRTGSEQGIESERVHKCT